MLKPTIKSIAWILFSLAILYLPLCFSALSFNPFEWGHLERFLLASFVWIGILVFLFSKFLPKPVYKP